MEEVLRGSKADSELNLMVFALPFIGRQMVLEKMITSCFMSKVPRFYMF